jgi:hypothetical protein
VPLRPEERLAAQALERWLLDFGLKVNWHGVEADPPDLCFVVESDDHAEKWAVEVTGLFQYVDWNGEEKNIRNVQAPLHRLSERLKKALPERTIVAYVVSASGPFDSDLKDIEQRAVDYIKSGKTEREYLDLAQAVAEIEDSLTADPADPRIRAIVTGVAERNARFTIQAITKPMKVSWVAGLDGTARTPDGQAMIADVMATLRSGVQRILDAKLPRMKALTGFQRRMLLIWSDYFFAEPERLKEVLDEKRLTADDVDTIFLIDGYSEVNWVADPAGLFGLSPNAVSEKAIATLAYKLWEQRGRPIGSAEVDWLEAERQLEGRRR